MVKGLDPSPKRLHGRLLILGPQVSGQSWGGASKKKSSLMLMNCTVSRGMRNAALIRLGRLKGVQ